MDGAVLNIYAEPDWRPGTWVFVVLAFGMESADGTRKMWGTRRGVGASSNPIDACIEAAHAVARRSERANP